MFIRSLLQALVTAIVAIGVTAQAAARFDEIEQAYPGVILEQLHKLEGVPWGMTFLTPTRLLITERGGNLRLLDLERNSATPVAGVPAVAARGQGGLMDVATGPAYASDGWIYFTYSKSSESGAATTLRPPGRGSAARLAGPAGDRFRHRQPPAFRQPHRLRRPGSRVFRRRRPRRAADGAGPRQSCRQYPAAQFGHRNPQGLLFDRESRRLWSIEHGPRGGDEINLIIKGGNYGWPIISHGKEYWGPVSIGEGRSKPGMEPPRKVYIPSIAPASLILYRGQAFPEWRGDLFAGALKLRHLNRVSLSESGQAIAETRLLEDLDERIRALAQSLEGWIYLSTDSGRILRLRPD
jgi:glucose/arabinose dehydrogenase